MHEDLPSSNEIFESEQLEWYLQRPPEPAPKIVILCGISTHLYKVWVHSATHNGNVWTRMDLPNQHAFLEGKVSWLA